MAKILTLDAGTSGLKCSLFEENGALAGAHVSEYAVDYPREGWAEQPASVFTEAAISAVRALSERVSLSDVDAIGLTGTMNGCLPIDEYGNALYPNIIHLDTRATAQVESMSARMGMKPFYEITGNRPDVHYGLPKMMWLKEHEPEIYSKARWCVNTKDVIYGFLTGIYGRSDYSDASLFGAMNIHARKWDETVCAEAQIDREKLPELFPSSDCSGKLCLAAARQMGLREGIPVAIGAGDGPCTTHGSGVYDENGVYLTVGSSAWVCALSNQPRIDPMMRAFNYTDIDETLTNVCGTVQCAATAFDFMMNTVLAVKKPDGGIDFEQAEALAAQSPPGAHGLFFLPTLMGERCPWWDADARGMLVGLTLTHTRADMARAAYEGVAQALNNCGDVLRENGIEIRDLILSGGGVKSGVWPQMFADIFRAPTRIHMNPREATSLGAAIAAGVGAGIYASYADAAKIVRTRAELSPDPARAEAYIRHTRVYRALYGQMKDAMRAISEYQRG